MANNYSETDPPLDTESKRNLLARNKLAVITYKNASVQYSCVQCEHRSRNKEDFQKHLLVHTNEYRFICDICGTGLKRREHLDRHTMEHQEIRPHVCPECGKAFKRKEHLNIHFTTHTGFKDQQCTVCKKSFYRKDHLQKHMQTHNKLFIENNIFPVSDQELDIKQEVMEGLENGNFEAEYSNISVDNSRSEILETSYIKLESGERPYVCLVCNKTYKRKDHLKLHHFTHVKKDKICSKCGKAFHKEEQLLCHMNTHFKDVNQEDVFEGEYSSDNSLLVPRRAVRVEPPEEDGERPHVCTHCGRRFKRKQHLHVHLNTHQRQHTHAHEQTIWCSYCNEGFTRNADYEQHSCPDHQQMTELEPRCEITEEDQITIKKENEFPTEFVEVEQESSKDIDYNLIKDESSLPVPQRVYVCKYCTKAFKRKDHYKIHLNIHTGIKSFFCPDCGKGFYRKDHMQKHVVIHFKNPVRRTRSVKKTIPELYPIATMQKGKDIKPEITIRAPSNSKLRVPLQIKVPYQVVLADPEPSHTQRDS